MNRERIPHTGNRKLCEFDNQEVILLRGYQKWMAPALLAALMLGLLSGCGQSGEPAEISAGETVQTLSLSGSDSAEPRSPAVIDLSSATVITLSGGTASV